VIGIHEDTPVLECVKAGSATDVLVKW
jgi:hypothetical protein